jgi:glycerophosphoryl diester phosphodiesterase
VKKKILLGVFVFIGFVWLNNTSLFIDSSTHVTSVLAHRGVHQTFHQQNMQNDTCTAERIYESDHGLMENTIASMGAAFEAGAEVVELDIHLTGDKQFAVFHDWEVDCRTDGTGVTQELEMAYLKTLDIGYGYTADNGASHPLRGSGIGLMPTLSEVFEAFPDDQFLINFKSRRVEEGEVLAAMLNNNPQWRKLVFGVYGGKEPTRATMELVAGLPGYDKNSIMSCLGQYVAYGWTGIIPGACRNQLVVVPGNFAWAMWGWPHKFSERMGAVGSLVIVLGPYGGGGFSSGIDNEGQTGLVPQNFNGLVWTNRVETMAALLLARE